MKTIPLTKGKVALVDDEDYSVLIQHPWAAGGGGSNYAVRYEKGKAILMHRLIVNPEVGQCVDHVNGNGLDNRRSNLRACSHQENMRNRRTTDVAGVSRFKGVYWEAKKRLWRARIAVDKKYKSLGRYKVEEDAARAYDRAARVYFGEFARVNFD